MFKKFSPSTDIAGQTPAKSSVQRAIRASILSQWKIEPETLEALWPKKESLIHVKWDCGGNPIQSREHVSIYTLHGEPLIIQHFDGPLYPTLRVIHKCQKATDCIIPKCLMKFPSLDPYILPKVGIDRGAIRYLLAGAPMMCPGLTSKGGYLPPAEEALPAGAAVAIHAEGKDNAVGIGLLKLGTEEIRRINKDVAVELATYLGDDLWAVKTL
ncbi:hypothetical protein H0H93_007250 [Arthromyces matolae]|nr:hypothetical protein H0H93_007250 [Arthromyces matolae]